MKIETLTVDFTDEQRYLEGFTTGLQISRWGAASARWRRQGECRADRAGCRAYQGAGQGHGLRQEARRPGIQARGASVRCLSAAEAAGARQCAAEPCGYFRWRYYGLFYVAPAQDLLHVPVADPERDHEALAVRRTGRSRRKTVRPFCHVTTRANLQVREIPPKNAVALIEGIQDLGLCSRGTGADNIRNVTGTPTAGIDPQELLDTREYAREWHYHILNDRSLYGLPRKFNVAFDGAGKIAVLEDTNDIAFSAVEVKDGFGAEPGVWFRLGLGGITGHRISPNTATSSSSRPTRPRCRTPSCVSSSISATAPTATRPG